MASSHYKVTTEKTIDSYVDRLIKCLTGLDSSSENYAIANKYIRSNLQHHKFLSVNKNEIGKEIAGISEKFYIHSQLDRGVRFEQLCKWFLERKLKNDVPDINYAVLSMIFKLANNPLENTFYIPRYQPKQKREDKEIDALRKETDLTEEIMREWGDFEPSDDEEEEEEQERDLEKESDEEKKEETVNRSQSTMLMHEGNLRGQQRTNNQSLNAKENNQSFMSMVPGGFSASKSVFFGGLPLAPLNEIAGLNVFRLNKPNEEVVRQEMNRPPSILNASNLENSNIQAPKWRKGQTSTIESVPPKKRNYLQMMEKPTDVSMTKLPNTIANETVFRGQLETTESAAQNEYDVYREDKEYIQRIYGQKDLWKNPNCLAEFLEKWQLREDQQQQQRFDLVGINHWMFEKKTERAIIQDVLLMLNGVESETFGVRQDTGDFELKRPIQVTHVSVETLKKVVEEFVKLANILVSLEQRLQWITEKFDTTVVEAFTESVKDIILDYKSFLEDVQCIFLKQASQVVLKNLDIKNKELTSYLCSSKTITLSRLAMLFQTRFNCFEALDEITQSLIKVFEASEQNNTGDQALAGRKAYLSSYCLTALHNVYSNVLMANGQQELKYLYTYLFFKSWRPYFSMLSKWLKSGFLKDRCKEFFITSESDDHFSTADPGKIDWNRDFQLQTCDLKPYLEKDQEVSFVLIPGFLRRSVSEILYIGKTIRIFSYLNINHGIDIDFVGQIPFKKTVTANLLELLESPNSNNLAQDTGFIVSSLRPNQTKDAMEPEQQPEAEKKQSLSKIKRLLNKDRRFGSSIPLVKAPNTAEAKDSPPNTVKNQFHQMIYQRSEDIDKYQISIFDLSLCFDKKINLENNKINEKNTKASQYSKFIKLLKEDRDSHERFYTAKIIFEETMHRTIQKTVASHATCLKNIFFSHFQLKDYFKIFNTIFFLENKSAMDPFLKEVMEKVVTFGFDYHIIKLKNVLKDVLKGIRCPKIANTQLEDLFQVEPDLGNDIDYKLSNFNTSKINFLAPYPLEMVFDAEVIKIYNKIFKLIIAIKKAIKDLCQADTILKKEDVFVKPTKKLRTLLDMDIESEDEERPTSKVNSPYQKELTRLRHKLCLAQRQLINFTFNFDFFVNITVIQDSTANFLKEINEHDDIVTIAERLKSYLWGIVEICQLTKSKKADSLFQVIRNILELCSDFLTLTNKLTEIDIYDGGCIRAFKRIEEDLGKIMMSFNASNRILFHLLNQYNHSAYRMQVKSLFNAMNFNYFYMSENGDYIR